MRIVAGAAKGRRLIGAPAGTRPTSDRAREGLFNSLTSLVDIDGAHVLDLYAGTGATGLEALSRGAARVVLVEAARAALRVCERNVSAVGLAGAQVVAGTVEAFVATAPAEPFDLVFADPPYALPGADLAELLAALAGRDWLAPSATVVIERSARDAGGPQWPTCVTPVRERRYGEGVLWYGRRR